MRIQFTPNGICMTPPRNRAEDTVHWWFIGQPIRNNPRVPRFSQSFMLVDLFYLEQLWGTVKKATRRMCTR